MATLALIVLVIFFFCAGYFFEKKYLKFCNRDIWEYGTCNGSDARRHKRHKNVQFIIFKKGDQAYVDGVGHKEDKWVDFDRSRWPDFVPNPEPACHKR